MSLARWNWSWGWSSAGGRRRSAAFTLLELILVLVIVTVLAGLIVPQLAGSLSSVRIGRAAEEVFAAAREARGHAVLRGLRTRLVLDVENRAFRVEEERHPLRRPGEWREFAGREEKPFPLPDGVAFESVVRGDEAVPGSDEAEVYFRPDGSADDARITLATEGGDRRIIEVRGITGRVRIVPEDEE